MSKQREEDLDTSLSGDENASGQAGEQRTKWYKRIRKGITTSTAEKKETPEGLWSKCPECNYICTTTELEKIFLFVQNAIITTALAVKIIMKLFLITKNTKNFLIT